MPLFCPQRQNPIFSADPAKSRHRQVDRMAGLSRAGTCPGRRGHPAARTGIPAKLLDRYGERILSGPADPNRMLAPPFPANCSPPASLLLAINYSWQPRMKNYTHFQKARERFFPPRNLQARPAAYTIPPTGFGLLVASMGGCTCWHGIAFEKWRSTPLHIPAVL